MADKAALESHLRFIPDEKRVHCRLRIDPGADPASITTDALLAYLDSKAVNKSRIDTDAIEQLAKKAVDEPEETHEAEVATGEPPVDGRDQIFVFAEEIDEEWQRVKRRAELAKKRVQQGRGFDEEPEDAPQDQTAAADSQSADTESSEQTDAAEAADAEERIDFYNSSAFVIVTKGQVIGKIEPAIPGEDGTDVFGAAVAARQGKSCSIKFERTVEVANDHTVRAAVSGRLVFEADSLGVNPELEINGHVDFSTGNIRFPGNVRIAKGIRDRFLVQSDGDVSVHDLVEAARIECGRDLTLSGGIAGREAGSLLVSGDLTARYLDAAEGDINGNATIDKEINNCRLTITGMLSSPNCAIRGGTITVGRRAEVLILGAEGGMTTDMRIGSAPRIEATLRKLEAFLETVRQRRANAEERLDMLNKLGGKMTATQAEELTELQFEQAEAQQHETKIATAYDTAVLALRTRTLTSLTVRKQINAKVTLYLRGHKAYFEQPAKGPILIELDQNNRPVFGLPTTSDRRPLSEIAKVNSDDTVLPLPVETPPASAA